MIPWPFVLLLLIGLATIKRSIETHGGRIGVGPEGLGQGSTFYFTLPEVPRNVDKKYTERV